MDATELRSLEPGELVERLTEAKEELFNLRFQLATSQLDNTARLSAVKKDIARILTVMSERDIRDIDERQTAEVSAGKDS